MAEVTPTTPCCFCGADLEPPAVVLTHDGRARCRSKACVDAEKRSRERSKPPPRRPDRVNYRDRYGNARSYLG